MISKDLPSGEDTRRFSQFYALFVTDCLHSRLQSKIPESDSELLLGIYYSLSLLQSLVLILHLLCILMLSKISKHVSIKSKHISRKEHDFILMADPVDSQ